MRSLHRAPQRIATDGGTVGPPGRAWHGWVSGIIYFACGAAFVGDLAYDIPWAFGVLYIPMVCTAVLHRDPHCVWWLAAIAIAMVVVGCFFPVANFGTTSTANRFLSIIAILTTAALVRLARSTRDRLEQQTLRAQAADRTKTQILANLSHELRTPLNAIIGFAELLAADCRPDQLNSLEHLRSASRRLLVTIENLLDLAHATDRVLRIEPLDLATILGQAIEGARNNATEQNVTLLNGVAAATPRAIGDAWAVRRISDNLIGNAVKFTAPGGSVQVSTEAANDRVFAVVGDTGGGMSADVLRQLGEPFFQAKGGADRPHQGMGTGLALCRRLADAMGAKLEFASEPGHGTTVRLGLRAAE